MGDAEAALPSSKKRVAGRQLAKDDPDPDDDVPEPEMGTFRKASEEVMAARRIVKVRRNQPPPDTSLNPFAGIRLVAPVDSGAQAIKPIDQPDTGCTTAIEQNDTNQNSVVTDVGKGTESRDSSNKIEDTEENNKILDEISEPSSAIGGNQEKNTAIEEKAKPGETCTEAKEDGNEKIDSEAVEEKSEDHPDKVEKKANEAEEGGKKIEKAVEESAKEEQEHDQQDPALPGAPLSSFQQLSSSQNAFSGLAGTGFSSSSFAFGSFAKEGSTFGTSSASPSAFKSENSSLFSFGTGSVNGDSSSPSFGSTPDASKCVKLSMQEVPIETGEENEKAVFTADAIMYEYLDSGWKERGKGELKLNVSVPDAEKARLVMRAKGNYRLILNASLYPDMSLTSMDKRGITFACINSAREAKDGLTTVALKFKDSSIVQEFRESVMTHKGLKASNSKPAKDFSKESEE